MGFDVAAAYLDEAFRSLRGHKRLVTDFLTSDGEKPWRNRDQEFLIAPEDTRPALMQRWEESWALLFQTLESLAPQDLGRTVYIRGQEHTVLQAINRQVAHYAYHVGQVVFLAKHLKGAEWQTLSIPRGKSNDVDLTRRLEKQRP